MSFSDLANGWVKGLGSYEPGRPIDEVARELGFASADDVLKLASNENALGPSPKAIKAMKAAASRMHIYPDGSTFYLRNAWAKKLGVETDQLLPLNGSNEGLEFLGHVFLGQDTNIVAADRAFVVYKLIAAMFRADTIAVKMRDYTHDLTAMRDAITDKTKIVFVANPNNPTSTMVEQEEIDDFMSTVPDNVVICFDEAYVELLPPDRRVDTLRYVRAGRNVVVLRTMSKSYGLAGLRIGCAIAPRECIELMERVRQPFNVNAMALEAALAALTDESHLVKTRRLVDRGLKMLGREFRKLGLDYVPGVANFLLVKVGSGKEVFEDLKREGVIVRPMDVYGLPEHIRVTVGKPAENRRLIDALRAVLGDGSA
jgi:histidinol-phosphate aminotransferase